MTAVATAVRPLAAADEGDWRRLWRDYLAFYQTSRADDVAAETFRRLIDPTEPMRGFAAVRDGAFIGICNCIVHRHGWSVADVLYLQDLYVDAAARGSGAGRAMIEAAYALADAEGLANVYWLTQTFNAEARILYDRIGVATPFMKYQRP